MALTNAERQRRFRERRRAAVPVKERPERRGGPAEAAAAEARWTAAVAELRQLQAEYEAWRDQSARGSLADSKTAQLLEGVCDVDLDVHRRRAAAGVRTRLNARYRSQGPDREDRAVPER